MDELEKEAFMRHATTLATQIDGRDLMLAVAAGVPGSFELLVRTYEARIKAAVARYVGDRRSVEDLSQEVLLRLFRARKRYAPTARFETFLYRIILNLCVNHTQYHRRRRALSLEQGADEKSGEEIIVDQRAKSPMDSAILSEQSALVREAIDRLPGNQKRALVLSRFGGMAYEEVAHSLGLSPEAVKSLLWRARENLRVSLRSRLAADFEG